MITVEGLVKTYQDARSAMVRAVDDVSFTVEEGQFYTLLGPSGCGKTTTLRCIAGLERADGGRIVLGSTEVASGERFVPANRRDIGMVFQSYAVWPHMSVFANVAFPLRFGHRRLRGAELRRKVRDVLELVGLVDEAERGATQLSGGQQQRLALARAVVEEPKVLLLDEPLSNLDAKLRERMRSEIRLLQRRLGITTVFVTHDQTEALSMSDRVAVMNKGKIIQEGTPREIYYKADSQFVANFIGSTNLIPGRVTDAPRRDREMPVETAFGTVRCAAGALDVAQGDVFVAIRPEEVVLQPSDSVSAARANTFPGVVQVDFFSGTYTDYFVKVDEAHLLRARISSQQEPQHEGYLEVRLPPEACRILTGEDANAAVESLSESPPLRPAE